MYLELLFALLACLTQPTQPPTQFTVNLLTQGHGITSDAFVGYEAPCGDETCYAGLIFIDGVPTLQTGP